MRAVFIFLKGYQTACKIVTIYTISMRKTIKKRVICFPIMSRVHYARNKRLLEKLRSNSKIDLRLVVGGSVLLEKYGEKFLPAIQKDGFQITDTLFNVVDGGTHIAMAKTAGLTALGFAHTLHTLNSDLLLLTLHPF